MDYMEGEGEGSQANQFHSAPISSTDCFAVLQNRKEADFARPREGGGGLIH